ncbi:hypothetical protein GC197_17945 [bacterium]|nr:hypothetical protein [bacterium]
MKPAMRLAAYYLVIGVFLAALGRSATADESDQAELKKIEEATLSLLKCPIADDVGISHLLDQLIDQEIDQAHWAHLIDLFYVTKAPITLKVLPGRLYKISTLEGGYEINTRVIAAKNLKRLFPDFDRAKPTAIKTASPEELTSALHATMTLSSDKLDQAALDLYHRARHFPMNHNRYGKLDDLQMACLIRMKAQKYTPPDEDEDFVWRHVLKICQHSSFEICPDPFGDYDVKQPLQLALEYFPEKSRCLIEETSPSHLKLSAWQKTYLLSHPVHPQPWMRQVLISMLDNTEAENKGTWSYGPIWNRHLIRECDMAAKAIADSYLHVRFEFEENPAYLDKQIAKIRRVIAGEKGISFAPPPRLQMPADLPTRREKRLLDIDLSFEEILAISNEKEIWLAPYHAQGNFSPRTLLKLDVEQNEVTKRVLLENSVNDIDYLIPNGRPDRAYSFAKLAKKVEITVRELPSARVLKQLDTPFHSDSIENAAMLFGNQEDSLLIRNEEDTTICGEDSQWVIAFPRDGKQLHSIDLASGQHFVEWEHFETPRFPSLVGVAGSSKVIVGGWFREKDVEKNVDAWPEDSFGAEPAEEESRLHVWDQATRTMRTLENTPIEGWHEGRANLAWNDFEDFASIWNLETGRRLPFPKTDDQVRDIKFDRKGATLFMWRGQEIDVFRIVDGESLEPISRLVFPPSVNVGWEWHPSMTLSSDDKWLFMVCQNKDAKEEIIEYDEKRSIAIFDISDFTK